MSNPTPWQVACDEHDNPYIIDANEQPVVRLASAPVVTLDDPRGADVLRHIVLAVNAFAKVAEGVCKHLPKGSVINE